MDFHNIDDALAVIAERFGSVPGDARMLLEASAAQDCTTGDPVYRPYYVLATLMTTRYQEYKRVRSASGAEVEYAGPGIARRALLDQQQLLDAHLCHVPPGVNMGDRFKVVM